MNVLHTLRCVGAASAERLASVSGSSEAEVVEELSALGAAGLATHDPGPFGGWSITDSGRAKDDEMIGVELSGSGIRSAVEDVYRRFLLLNPVFLSVCSDWQMRRIGSSPVLNDHRDTSYDVAVLDRLGRVHDRLTPILTDLAGALSRFSTYQARFDTALQSALGGQVEAVADSFDSCHSVWFQLHEDLLTSLGISREEERRRMTGDE